MAGGTLTVAEITNVEPMVIFGGTASKSLQIKTVTLNMATTQAGGSTNKIPASALGLLKILSCTNLVSDGNDKVWPASPSYDGDYIIVADADNAAVANHIIPADVTADVYRVGVIGYS